MKLSTLSHITLTSCALAAGLCAQAPSPWSVIPIDHANAQIHSRVHSLAVQEPSRVLLYSGFQRRWVVLPVSSSAVVTAQNEHTLIVDGDKMHGWSPRYASIDTITVSASASIVPPPSSANFVVTVQDGTTIHAYGAAAARWSTLDLTTQAPTISTHRRCTIVHDGANAYGYSPFSGLWVKAAAPDANITLASSGGVGVANSASVIRAFSSVASAWSFQAVASTAQLTLTSGLVIVEDGARVHAFSGQRAGFVSYQASGSFTVTASNEIATIEDDAGVTCYSSVRGALASRQTSGPVSVDVAESFALITSASGVVAYSGVTNSFCRELAGSYTQTRGDTVAFLAGGTSSFAYSCLLQDWFEAPRLSVDSVKVLSHSVLLQQGALFSGFASRFGRWVSQPASSQARLVTPSRQGSGGVVVDAQTVHAWAPRHGAWRSVQVDTSALATTSVRFSSALLEDGTRALGFGTLSGEFDAVTIHGAVTNAIAGSGLSRVETATHLYVHTALPTLTSTAPFPEADGFASLGSSFEIQQVATPGSLALLLLGIEPTRVSTSAGSLLVDAPSALPAAAIPSGGSLRIDVPVPANTSLIGVQLQMQSFIVPPTQQAYLTGSISPVLL